MKNTFLQSPVIALHHMKNSAWAIEKVYSKTCVRKGSLRFIDTTIEGHTRTIFTRVEAKFKAKKVLRYLAYF